MKSSVQIVFLSLLMLSACTNETKKMVVDIYETSASGNKLTKVSPPQSIETEDFVNLFPTKRYQKITGFGGSFTESSAYLLNQMSPAKRTEVIEAYFGSQGSQYSLTRTHINSCDFSLSNYSYAPIEGDNSLENFSIEEDRDDIIPMIKEAMDKSVEGFKIISSPWTAPPWMKDNNSYVGGKLLPEHYPTWALFFSKYLEAYKQEGIDIWGVTVENEPLGNGNNWESMHFTPEEMVEFVRDHLGPKLEADGHKTLIFGYDQNRDHLEEWVKVMYADEASSKYFAGTAIHWYANTVDWRADALQATHQVDPAKYMIQSEACVDAEVPKWKDDAWYWSKEATDWGWDWAPEEEKKDHPKYVPVYRYARDIIGCLNNWVDGWVDWNMVLDRQGGPNWFKNWCVAPVIVDPELDEIYYTPIYHTLAHFSKFIRPEAQRIGFEQSDQDVMVTAAQNPDGSIAVVVLNMHDENKAFNLVLNGQKATVQISGKAIQTIVIPNSNS